MPEIVTPSPAVLASAATGPKVSTPPDPLANAPELATLDPFIGKRRQNGTGIEKEIIADYDRVLESALVRLGWVEARYLEYAADAAYVRALRKTLRQLLAEQ